MYCRHIPYDGARYQGSAYGLTREKAIAGLANSIMADLSVAESQVPHLKRLLASIPSGVLEKATV